MAHTILSVTHEPKSFIIFSYLLRPSNHLLKIHQFTFNFTCAFYIFFKNELIDCHGIIKRDKEGDRN